MAAPAAPDASVNPAELLERPVDQRESDRELLRKATEPAVAGNDVERDGRGDGEVAIHSRHPAKTGATWAGVNAKRGKERVPISISTAISVSTSGPPAPFITNTSTLPLHTAVPTYLYQEILPDGSEGETFEHDQPMSDAPLETHPVNGNPVRRVYTAPNLPTQYTEGQTKAKLSDSNVEKHGFTRYEKDKVTGKYHKTAGADKRAPDVVDAARLRKMQQGGS